MINGKQLRDAIISGANNIANHRQQVDALNVFPVPDGDTGTNMSMTISAAKNELEKVGDDATVSEVAQTAASALLRGARGNSGVILSLIFRGFSKAMSGKSQASSADVADALAQGVDTAYKAVMKPTEGTILTVGRLAAEQAKTLVQGSTDDIRELWQGVVAAAGDALEKTPDMLPVLKKAGVVDAGGKGLLVLFEGVASVINDGVILPLASSIAAPTVEIPITPDEYDLARYDDDPGNTYCTEFLVNRSADAAPLPSPLSFRAWLAERGDSLVFVDDDELIKVHIHTEDPGAVLQEALKLGGLSRIKIENMREQVERLRAEAHAQQLAQPPRTQAEGTAAAQPAFAYRAVDESVAVGFVAVAAGEGIQQLFRDLGVDNVVSGGQTMNPSTEDILAAVQATPARTVYVLPNNKNIIMAAELAIPLADRKVMVLPTVSIPQGLAAMLANDTTLDANENYIEMNKAAGRVSTGQVTFAVRDSVYEGHKIKEGEMLALENGKLAFTEKDCVKAAVRLTRNLIKSHTGASFVTVLYGEGVTAAEAAEVEEKLRSKLGDEVEITVIDGGQPVYYYIISVE